MLEQNIRRSCIILSASSSALLMTDNGCLGGRERTLKHLILEAWTAKG